MIQIQNCHNLFLHAQHCLQFQPAIAANRRAMESATVAGVLVEATARDVLRIKDW